MDCTSSLSLDALDINCHYITSDIGDRFPSSDARTNTNNWLLQLRVVEFVERRCFGKLIVRRWQNRSLDRQAVTKNKLSWCDSCDRWSLITATRGSIRTRSRRIIFTQKTVVEEEIIKNLCDPTLAAFFNLSTDKKTSWQQRPPYN